MRTAVLVLPVLLALVACNGDEEDGGGSNGSTTGTATACSADTRKDVYSAGMEKAAADLKVRIVESAFTPNEKPVEPGQVQKGMNAITVEVADASGAPVDGATVSLDLWMPDHAHGSARPPKIAPLGGGKYQITEVWLPMAGLWRFTVGVTTAGATPRSAEFNFCIDG